MPVAPVSRVPGHPLHVIQRGFCRAACFVCERDRIAYLGWLACYAAETGCAVHAYVLMRNHVHLLATPTRADGVAALMRLLSERHARCLAETYGRVGAIWEERFEAWPIYPRRYLLACMRYIELNPVRAGLVERPGDYRWSSYRSNAMGEEDALLTPHGFYCALGRTRAARQVAYQALFRESSPAGLRARS